MPPRFVEAAQTAPLRRPASTRNDRARALDATAGSPSADSRAVHSTADLGCRRASVSPMHRAACNRARSPASAVRTAARLRLHEPGVQAARGGPGPQQHRHPMQCPASISRRASTPSPSRAGSSEVTLRRRGRPARVGARPSPTGEGTSRAGRRDATRQPTPRGAEATRRFTRALIRRRGDRHFPQLFIAHRYAVADCGAAMSGTAASSDRIARQVRSG